jgi:arylsulfatase A-like enzyme
MANVLLRASAVVLAAFALALLYLRLPESGARADRAPCEGCNIVLISFDTVRADHLGTYGYARPTSPHVDALASRSTVFERAISQAPWTLPAHGSMFSGLYPSRLGVLKYPATRALPDKNPVLAELLRAQGYATAGFTGGGFVSGHYGFDRGFDIYESDGRRFEHNIDATIDWIEEHKKGKFFLFFHGYDAHRPYYSKPDDKLAMELGKDAEDDQGRFCLSDDRARPDDARLEKIIRYYDASIRHGDRAIGVLLETLERMKLMDDTVILLTSDHGEEFFEHGNCDHVRFVYEESVHVPYMVYVPKAEGRRIDGIVPASISVTRTLLDLVGIEHAMPGVSLVPLLQGRHKGFPVVYSEAESTAGVLGSRGATMSMTKDKLKLISYTDEGTDEAYDLEEDPTEQTILPERSIAYLYRQTLRAWRGSLKPLPRPEKKPEDRVKDEDRERRGGRRGDDRDGRAADGAASEPAADAAEYAEPAPAVGPPSQKAAPGVAPEPPPLAKPAPRASEDGRRRPGARSKQDGPSKKRDGSESKQERRGREEHEEEGMKVPKELEESLKSLGYLE